MSGPGRVVAKIRLKPSFERAGCESLNAELTLNGQGVMPSLIVSALRLTGGDHGPYFCAWAVGTIVSATKRASAAASFVLFFKNWFFILSPVVFTRSSDLPFISCISAQVS